ncbi:hypothetical protein M427DRAFT_35065 [Gonapodya prolifera JEL478]|uniref:N-acetyltransferase domain-containing protein n=1 Tax=Gonapodya prolifera (strain JEL478) TaxID=1344416 RepID=A0A139A5R1_GONPJ|nr:hypothetical protein M427DRAFT_35065 [Gonapodya prolifera JEL478]|eukprot:KXS11988.1 hypothetical protein M427DRAFT_35065 [Gonapodya prolifera JEL478]
METQNPIPAHRSSAIHVRLYQPGDKAQVLRIFRRSFIDVINDAIGINLATPRIVAAVEVAAAAGTLLISRWRKGSSLVSNAVAGMAIAVTAVPAVVAIYYYALVAALIYLSEKSDMGDIETHYSPVGRDGTPRLNAFFVAIDKTSGAILGVVGVQPSTKPHCAELRRMCVSHESRRKGVGSALCQAVVEHVSRWNSRTEEESQRVHRIVLATTAYQAPAMGLYERQGWRRSGELVSFAFGFSGYYYSRDV